MTPSPRKLYVLLALTLEARANCIKSGNTEWKVRHEERIKKLVSSHLPSGSGFDNGTEIDLDASTSDKLVFYTGFHHMSGNGFYEKWTDHTVIVRANLAHGFDLHVTGRNHREVKGHIAEIFHSDLSEEIDEQTDRRVA